jgi:hypothetical protein
MTAKTFHTHTLSDNVPHPHPMRQMPTSGSWQNMLRCICLVASIAPTCSGQTPVPSDLPVLVEHIVLRPARWEEHVLTEPVNERRNLGGLAFVYFRNQSDKTVSLREWYLNERESGHYRLAYDIAWDRTHTKTLHPGQTSVLEICGTAADFQPGKPAFFSWIGSDWEVVAACADTFREAQVDIPSIIVDSTLRQLTVHFRNRTSGRLSVGSVELPGGPAVVASEWTASTMRQGGHLIARFRLQKALTTGQLFILKASFAKEDGGTVTSFTHRHAYPDHFPNGTWGIEPDRYGEARRHHLNIMVRNGRSDDQFFSEAHARTGIRAMPHTGIHPDIALLQDLQDHPAVACWYLQDEPDWLLTPQSVHACETMTRRYAPGKPTMLTLCRNVKFFEYAFLPDIACHDHYSVTAPTTSRWPHPFGTRLEETGYYTADLKYAAAPKPIWVWTQGLHLWEERPLMPLPTPDELGAQLYFNLGRGAKGNLWFTFLKAAAERYPATRQALQAYGRAVRLLSGDLLQGDPYGYVGGRRPPTVDVAAVYAPERLVLFLVNTDYDMLETGYAWRNSTAGPLELPLPDGFIPKEVFEVDPWKGLHPVVGWSVQEENWKARLPSFGMGKIWVLSRREGEQARLQEAYDNILAIERQQEP